MPFNTKRLAAAIGRRLRMITVRLCRHATSHRDFYRLSTGQDDSSHGASGLKEPDPSANASSQAWLPIGPSCC
jgi:hypothetical protein